MASYKIFVSQSGSALKTFVNDFDELFIEVSTYGAFEDPSAIGSVAIDKETAIELIEELQTLLKRVK